MRVVELTNPSPSPTPTPHPTPSAHLSTQYPTPAGASTAPPPCASAPSRTADATAQLAALAPLTEELARSVTCPICLEPMTQARQLQCGHLFCAECVVRMLGMPRVRCAICKEKTGKRMVRRAPLPFADIVRELRVLEEIVAECAPRPTRDFAALNDGFGAVLQTTLARIQARPPRVPSEGAEVPLGKTSPVQVAETVVEPAVDPAMELTPARAGCVLCPRGVDPSSFSTRVSFGGLEHAASERKKRNIMVHEQCALFSIDVYEVGDQFENVELLLGRTKKLICSRDACGRSRPNVWCAVDDCHVKFHYPCAVVEGCTLVEDGFKMFCPKHKQHAPKIGEKEFGDNLCDPDGAFSLQHEDSCYKCASGGRLLMCDTCPRVTHPVCSGLKGIPLGDWSCGVCTGQDSATQEDAGPQDKVEDRRSGSGSKRRRSESPGNKDSVTGSKHPLGERGTGAKRSRNSLEGGKKFILANTGLNESQKELLKGIAKMKRTSLRRDLDGRVTHMVISAYTPDDNPGRTMKLCKAIASKTPILCWKWVEESAECTDGWARIEKHIHPLTWPEEEDGMFHGKRFYFGGYGGPREMKEDLQALVQLGGGSLVHREPSSDMAPSHMSLLYVRDEEFKKVGRRELLARYEPPPGATTVSSSWILDKCTKGRHVKK